MQLHIDRNRLTDGNYAVQARQWRRSPLSRSGWKELRSNDTDEGSRMEFDQTLEFAVVSFGGIGTTFS